MLHFTKLLCAVLIVGMMIVDIVIYRRLLKIDLMILGIIALNLIYRIAFIVAAASIIYKTNREKNQLSNI